MKRRIDHGWHGWARMAVGVAVLVAGVAFGAAPVDRWTVEYRTKGAQFDIVTKRMSTPTWVFDLTEGDTAWTATGWTNRLHYWKSPYSEAMVTIDGVVSGSSVTFSPSSNDLAQTMEDGYVALTIASNDQVVTFGVGTIQIQPAPEISATGVISRTRAIVGAEYGPFSGDFSGWPFVTTMGTGGVATVTYVDAQDAAVSNWAAGAFAGVTITNGLYPASNPSNWVTQAVTNGLVPEAPLTTSQYARSNGQWVVVSATGGGTGDVSQVYLDANYYPRSNPSNWVTAAVTTGLYQASNPSNWVTQGVTNGLWNQTDGTNWTDENYYPRNNPSNWVTAAVTNGLYPASNPSNWVTAAVTTGLAQASQYLPLAGGTMAGTLNAGGYQLTNASSLCMSNVVMIFSSTGFSLSANGTNNWYLFQ